MIATAAATRLRRLGDVTGKAWDYWLEALRDPAKLPFIAHSVAARKAHLGELLVLSREGGWLRAAGVETVIDVGANSGCFASAVRCVLPKAQIYSFEPLPDVHEALVQRMSGFGRFEAFCVALGARQGETSFWRCNSTKSSSVLTMSDLHRKAFPWTAEGTRVTVQADTLDNYRDRMELRRKIMLKIDVQGFEREVLLGASAILRQVSYVQVETSFRPLYEGQASFADIYGLMESSGFEYAGSSGHLHSPLDGTLLQEDILFRNKSADCQSSFR